MSDPVQDGLPALPIHDRLEVRRLDPERETLFAIRPDAAARAALAELMGVESIGAVAMDGTVRPEGKAGFLLEGRVTGTVTQLCVVTLDPLETAIDRAVSRSFQPGGRHDGVIAVDFGAGTDPEEAGPEPPEPLGDVIDLAAILVEELALAIDPYPRAPGAEHGETHHAAPGVAPIDPESLKPFAGLAALRARMTGTDDGEGGGGQDGSDNGT